MFSKIYNYQNVGVIYKYKGQHSFKVIDLIEERALGEHEINIDFSLKLIGKDSSGGSIFKFETHHVILPEVLSQTIPDDMSNFIAEYQKVSSDLQLRLDADGIIESIQNVDEIKQKWIDLRRIIMQVPQTPVLEELLQKGDLEYGIVFQYEEILKSALFFKVLFPCFYNSFYEFGSEISDHKANSSMFPDLTLPVTSYFDYNEENDLVILNKEFYQNNTDLVKKHYNSLNRENEFKNYFYQHATEYSFDQGDHISNAELIQIESLNGTEEIINHIQIWKYE